MQGKRILACVLASCVISAGTVNAQPGDRHLDMKARVLSLVFPIEVSAKPYDLRLILRYGDTDTQLVVVVHPGKEYWQRRYDVFRYTLAGMKQDDLSHLISRMEASDPKIGPQEIAAKLRVEVAESAIDPSLLKKALSSLGDVRVSPALPGRVCLDKCSQYEFWYDTWQDFVHYVLTDPPQNTAEAQLVEWMTKFRADLPNMLTRPWTRAQ